MACLIECVFPPMSEWELAALESLRKQHSVMSYTAQCQHDPHGFQREQLSLEVGVAPADFVRQGLVLRGHTFDRVSDPSVPQLQSVVRRDRLGPGTQSQLVQGLV